MFNLAVSHVWLKMTSFLTWNKNNLGMFMKKLLLLLPLFFMQNTFAAPTPSKPDPIKPVLQNYMDHWRTENNIPGMSLSVFHANDETLTTVTSGKRQLHPSAPVTSNTFFEIGSVTKTFTSAAILKLEAKGRLSIHEKIGKWFPQYPRWKDITVKQLMNMTSGIGRYEDDASFTKTNGVPSKDWSTDDVIALAYKQPNYAAPGAEWHYSNTNYLLLGQIIEKITGEALDSVFNTYFYSKYHLNHTMVMSETYGPLQLKKMAHGYQDDNDITSYNLAPFGAEGGMVSTSQDMVTWANALFSGDALPERQRHEFLSTVAFDAPPRPKNSRYGLGIYYTHSDKYGDIWWYSGVTSGYVSLFMYLPQEKLVVAGNINRIKGDDYGLLMPDQEFVTGLLPIVVPEDKKEEA